LLKDLDIARNCLLIKHVNKPNIITEVETVEFNPAEENIPVIVEITDDDSGLEMLVIQKSKGKTKTGMKKCKVSLGRRKQDQEDLGLHNSRNVKIPMNLNKRKNKGKNDDTRPFFGTVEA